MSADFDKAIDGAVREMLDVEPAAGLRARVVEQLSASGSRLPAASAFRLPASGWILAPLAAVAILILALVLPRSTPQGTREAETTTAAGETPRLPVTAPPPAIDPRASVEMPRPVGEPRTVAARRGPAARRSVTATALMPDDSPASDIAPLTAINAIAVAPIGERTIAPGEIAVRPLTPITEVQVAPLTPPERRN